MAAMRLAVPFLLLSPSFGVAVQPKLPFLVRLPPTGLLEEGSHAVSVQTPPPDQSAVNASGTAAADTGVTANAAGDLDIFIVALVGNAIFAGICVTVFCCLRPRFPIMYSHNCLIGEAPSCPPQTKTGWIPAVYAVTTREAMDSCGLDNAMLLEFFKLAKKIMRLIGIPMILIMGPMNCAFGGFAAGDDYLSYLSFGNVENGSWLYWVHCWVIWGVVFAVQSSLYQAMEYFLEFRFTWLREMTDLRANTVLVEGIPCEYQSDAALTEFFSRIFPQNGVQTVYVTKDTASLTPLVSAYESADSQLKQAEAHWENDGNAPDMRPMHKTSLFGSKVDSIDHWTQVKKDLEPQIAEEKDKIKSEAAIVGGVNCTNGFVTFNRRTDSEIAMSLNLSHDLGEWIMSNPPEPNSIRWDDFVENPESQGKRNFLGYVLVAGLYFAYLPVVIGITNIAMAIDMGPLQVVWAALAPTLGLQFMVAMLPTFLITIFKFTFTLKTEAMAQKILQSWLFWFYLVFVVLVTAIGTNIMEFTAVLVANPFGVVAVFATTMPYATHFYMNYLVLQWVTHCMVLMRHTPLSKFKFFSKIFNSEEVGKKMAEPEDQDYFGIGNRSAQSSIVLAIGIIYGTLSPLINLLTYINFGFCTLCYGYLIPFAETRKPDIGGYFWVTQLDQLFIANIIYVMTMSGVLSQRSDSSLPGLIAMSSVIYVLWSRRRFSNHFTWERLPFTEVMEMQDSKEKVKKRSMDGTYVQPELR